jgi:biotin carboxyl carrier protein
MSNIKTIEVSVDGEKFKVEVNIPNDLQTKSTLAKPQTIDTIPPIVHQPTSEPILPKGETGILAPMPGIVIEYKKSVGDAVKTGEVVVVLEAMKMYNNLYASCDGVIKALPFKAGDIVKKYDVLCIIGGNE